MSNEITIHFAPCEPTPADGYRLKYRPVGAGAYSAWPDHFTDSPAVFNDSGAAEDGMPYEGFLQADCGDGDLGELIPWTTAEESSSVPPACVAVQFVESDLPDAVVGEPYVEDLHLTGDAPFFIGSQTNPAWMTVTLDGSVIHLTGTPPTDFPDAHVDIEVLNCSNTHSATFDAHFDQVLPESSSVPPECDHVAITATTLPGGTVGVPYDQLIPLTGDAPFSLSAVTKPAWAAVAISGDNVEISGTPTDAETETIAFTVTNCVEFSDEFSQEIDIATGIAEGGLTIDACLEDGRVMGISFNGDSVGTTGDGYPVFAGDSATLLAPETGTHALVVDITAVATSTGRVVVTGSDGTVQCQEFTATPTAVVTFAAFNIDATHEWSIAIDCGTC